MGPNGQMVYCSIATPPPGSQYCPKPTPTPSWPIPITPIPTSRPVNNTPQIRNQSLPQGRIGTRYSAMIIATDPDAGDTVNITTSRLPEDLRLNCNIGRSNILPNNQITCRIEGTPEDRGKFAVRIRARDSRGASTEKTFKLMIVRRKAPLPALQPLFDLIPF